MRVNRSYIQLYKRESSGFSIQMISRHASRRLDVYYKTIPELYNIYIYIHRVAAQHCTGASIKISHSFGHHGQHALFCLFAYAAVILFRYKLDERTKSHLCVCRLQAYIYVYGFILGFIQVFFWSRPRNFFVLPFSLSIGLFFFIDIYCVTAAGVFRKKEKRVKRIKVLVQYICNPYIVIPAV